MRLIVLSGLSGSGKSVALKALEDMGYTCVDNLPTPFLAEWCRMSLELGESRIAASIDVRGHRVLKALPEQLEKATELGLDVRLLFLEASDEALVKRFSETRRNHPLSQGKRTVPECIAIEREMLADVSPLGHRIDTSRLSPANLRQWVQQFTDIDHSQLTLIFQSFGFKHGVPLDADFVFDVRCLPNPFYEPSLRPLTGKDEAVVEFLKNVPDVHAMYEDIRHFVARWLPCFIKDHRHFLTVAVGCTGGQHRSVYLTERLAKAFAETEGQVLVRHRETSA